MPQALFYPWTDIRDETWLKTSLLHWDSVRTIVPESIATPYSTETSRALELAGYLVPFRVHSGMQEIEELTGEVINPNTAWNVALWACSYDPSLTHCKRAAVERLQQRRLATQRPHSSTQTNCRSNRGLLPSAGIMPQRGGTFLTPLEDR